MKIALGSEHAGLIYRERLAEVLRNEGHEVIIFEESEGKIGYPVIAEETSLCVLDQDCDFGILICGTGIGMCMAASKVPGIRAALCTDAFMSRMAKQHNDANLICFGARVLAFEYMVEILHAYMNATYEGGRHVPRLNALAEVESHYLRRS